MEFIDLIRKNRSYRSFDSSVKLTKDEVISFIDCARLSASAANNQPLKYYVSTDDDTNATILGYTAWAAKLHPRVFPPKGHEPCAYIVICVDTAIQSDVHKADRDVGIAAQSILLAATAKGFGGLMIGAFNRKGVKEALKLDESLEPALTIALGKPDEQIILEDAQGSVDYYRDDNDIHHVPKRPLSEIIVEGTK